MPRSTKKKLELVKLEIQPVGDGSTVMAGDWPPKDFEAPPVTGYFVRAFVNVKQGGKVVGEEVTQPVRVSAEEWPDYPATLRASLRRAEADLEG